MSAPILVIGATGTTGRIVTQLLLESGAQVRPTSRSPSEGQVRFDWMDAETWPAVLDGIERMYLIGPIGAAEPAPLVRPFLEQGLAAGLRRVVLLSSSGVEPGDSGLGALSRLISQIMPEWAVLRPSWFMQNLTGMHGVAQGLRAGRVTTSTGAGRVAFVDAADIAAVAVRALLDESPLNTDLVITGPTSASYAEICEMVSELTGRTISFVDVGATELTVSLIAQGIPAEFATVLAALDNDIRHGSEDRVTNTVERITGRKPTSVDTFLRTHAAHLTAPQPLT